MADNQHDATTDFNEALRMAFAEGTYDDLAQFYTADTVLLPPRGRMLEGRGLVSAFWRGVKNRFAGMEFTTTGLKSFGDDAKRETGTYRTIAADGAEGGQDGKYVFVWQRVGGEWQIESSIWNRNGTPVQGEGQGRRAQGEGQRRGPPQGGGQGGGQRRDGQGGGYRQGGGGAYRQGGQAGGGYRQGGGGYRQGGQNGGRPSFQGGGGGIGGGRRGGGGGQQRGGGQGGGQDGSGRLYDQGGSLYSDLKD